MRAYRYRLPRSLFVTMLALLPLATANAIANTQSTQIQQTAVNFRQRPIASGLQMDDAGVALAKTASTSSFVSAPIASAFAFNAVGAHWLAEVPAGTRLTVYLRASSDGQHWSDWLLIPADDEPLPASKEDGQPNPFAGDRVGALAFVHPGSRYVQYRVDFSRAVPAERLYQQGLPVLQRMTLNVINSSEGPEIAFDRPGSSVPARDKASATVPKPQIYKRSEWGARPPTHAYEYTYAQHLGVHHTAGVSDYNVDTFSDCAARVRAIQAYHIDTNGWWDIGYNYTICKHGHIFQAREDDNDGDDVKGAHDGFNAGSMGVSMLGYFHPPYNQQPTSEMLHALYTLLAWKCDERHFDPLAASLYPAYGAVRDNIYGHREVKATACPGDILFAMKQMIRDSTAEIIAQVTTGVDDNPPGGPVAFRLSPSYPNPFSLTSSAHGRASASIKIAFELPTSASVTLRVYNLLGQQVRALWNRSLVAGRYETQWDGRDEHNALLPAGVYFVRLASSSETRQTKILLVR